MKPLHDDEVRDNPYASPAEVDACDAQSLLRSISALYIKMGFACIAYACAYFILMLSTNSGASPRAELVVMLVGLGLFSLSLLCLLASRYLDRSRPRTIRAARWLAIFLALLLFPIVTIPGIVAVRRLNRYQRLAAQEGV